MYQFHSLYLFKKQIFIPDVITNILSTLKVDFQKDEEFEYMSLNIEETPMKVIKQEQTAATPKVTLDKKSGLMEIMGASIPEDADALYVPIVDWLEEYAENPNEKTIFNFGLKYFNTSSSILIGSFSIFFFKIAILVSKSGGWTSTIKPQQKREISLSSRLVISFGGRSEDIMICLWGGASSWGVSFHISHYLSLFCFY